MKYKSEQLPTMDNARIINYIILFKTRILYL